LNINQLAHFQLGIKLGYFFLILQSKSL